MPSNRKPKSFRPLNRLPKPQTAAAREERRLRELEAEETAQDALRFARDIQRRQALEDQAAQRGEPLHQPAGGNPPPDDDWLDLPPPNEHEAEGHNDTDRPEDPIILSLHDQAKQMKRQKLLERWEAEYTTLFDVFLQCKHLTKDWSTSEWSQDVQPACNCGPASIRHRQVVLVDLHSTLWDHVSY